MSNPEENPLSHNNEIAEEISEFQEAISIKGGSLSETASEMSIKGGSTGFAQEE